MSTVFGQNNSKLFDGRRVVLHLQGGLGPVIVNFERSRVNLEGLFVLTDSQRRDTLIEVGIAEIDMVFGIFRIVYESGPESAISLLVILLGHHYQTIAVLEHVLFFAGFLASLLHHLFGLIETIHLQKTEAEVIK